MPAAKEQALAKSDETYKEHASQKRKKTDGAEGGEIQPSIPSSSSSSCDAAETAPLQIGGAGTSSRWGAMGAGWEWDGMRGLWLYTSYPG